ncbi:CheR family methyltransferase [Thermodesulfobacteriota bacterium]
MLSRFSEKEFDLYRNFVKKKLGISLRPERRLFLGRKMAPRLQKLGLESYTLYYRHLQKPEGRKELQHLINIVTIGQTGFFRGIRQFELLRDQIIPDIFQRKMMKKQIRIWSAGCSTGQEPYCLAVLMEKIAPSDLSSWDIKILATDVDTNLLKIAFRGEYSEDVVSDVPPEYLLRFFSVVKRMNKKIYTVKEGPRSRLVFRKLNLVQTPYPLHGPLDLILCRNVMIYFDALIKKKIVDEFHRLLGENGYLCFGFSESLLGKDSRFTLIRSSVYRKKNRSPFFCKYIT